jgi:hypothetical protein
MLIRYPLSGSPTGAKGMPALPAAGRLSSDRPVADAFSHKDAPGRHKPLSGFIKYQMPVDTTLV